MGMQTEMTTRRDARARRTLVGAPTMAVPALAAVPALVMALVVLLTPLQAAPAAAQGWIQTLPDRPGSGVVKLRTDVRVTVTGRIAEVEVEEWFENRAGGLGEGDYLYPLPGGAVFSNFSLYQGDQELTGETMAAEDARGIYEEIVRRQKDPALIELVGHGLVRARVFPIEPGDRRRITLRYTQVLDRAGDALQFRYAAGSALSGPGTVPGPVVRPVPLPRPRTVPDTIPGSPNVRAEGDRSGAPPRHVAPIRFTLTADAGEFRRPFSPTHDLQVDERGGMLRVRPRSDLRGDFSVFLPLEGGLIGMTL
ncbi:MAG TPA: VIT domain-containing protein, partial [Longimicrobiales bacterium]|nr:VIT domain-containing protein [Longimicrobiales bacterium]